MSPSDGHPSLAGPRGRLIVVDHSLVGVAGHHFEYDSAVVAAACEAGIASVLLGHIDYVGGMTEGGSGTAERLLVEPWFRRGAYTTGEGRWLRRLLYPTIAALPPALGRALHLGAGVLWARVRRRMPDLRNGLGASLLAALDRLGADTQDAVLIHTLGPDDLEDLAAALFAAADRSRSLPRLHLLLRRTPQEMDRGRSAGRRVGDILQRFAASDAWRDRLRFHSDTAQLVAGFSALSAIRFGLLPIVFRHDLLDAALAAAPRASGAPLTVTYLGDARIEKGFQHLPALVACVLAARPTGSVRFVIQSTFNLPGAEPGIRAAVRRLVAFEPTGLVHLVHKAPVLESFYALLAAADVVILPYDRAAYAMRSSGIQAQAMAAGRPVLVPAGTWLADELAAGSGAGLAFEGPFDLAPGLLALLENYASFRRRAEAAAPAWRARHHPRQLVERVMAKDEGAQSPGTARPSKLARPESSG